MSTVRLNFTPYLIFYFDYFFVCFIIEMAIGLKEMGSTNKREGGGG